MNDLSVGYRCQHTRAKAYVGPGRAFPRVQVPTQNSVVSLGPSTSLAQVVRPVLWGPRSEGRQCPSTSLQSDGRHQRKMLCVPGQRQPGLSTEGSRSGGLFKMLNDQAKMIWGLTDCQLPGQWCSCIHMSHSLNSLQGLYRGLYRGLLQGLLRGILGV